MLLGNRKGKEGRGLGKSRKAAAAAKKDCDPGQLAGEGRSQPDLQGELCNSKLHLNPQRRTCTVGGVHKPGLSPPLT